MTMLFGRIHVQQFVYALCWRVCHQDRASFLHALSKSNKDNDMQLAQSNLKNLHVTAHHHLAATAFACYGKNTSLRLSLSCNDRCHMGAAKDQAMQTLPHYDHWTTLLVCNQPSYHTVNSAGLHACYTVLMNDANLSWC